MIEIIERIENLNIGLAVVTIALGGITIYLVIWIKELTDKIHDLEEKIDGIEFEKSVKDFL